MQNSTILYQVCPKSVPGQSAASIILKARNSIDMATLMLTLNQKNRTRFRNQLINPLIKMGLIEEYEMKAIREL